MTETRRSLLNLRIYVMNNGNRLFLLLPPEIQVFINCFSIWIIIISVDIYLDYSSTTYAKSMLYALRQVNMMVHLDISSVQFHLTGQTTLFDQIWTFEETSVVVVNQKRTEKDAETWQVWMVHKVISITLLSSKIEIWVNE